MGLLPPDARQGPVPRTYLMGSGAHGPSGVQGQSPWPSLGTNMPHADFVHLRVHSAYSLSEGAIRVDQIASLAREAGMPAVAMTDTANLFGALEFSQYCVGKGVQPIIGCQISVTRNEKPGLAPDPIVLLAQTEAGISNLQNLSSAGFLHSDPAAPQ